jgi:anti-sigma B factor antagonist
MNIEVKTKDGITVVEIHGDIDSKTAPTVQDEILPLSQTTDKLLLDMKEVEYMSSAGLRVLLLLYRQLAAKKGKIVLVGLSQSILDTMSVTGFLKFFTIGETAEEGLSLLQG